MNGHYQELNRNDKLVWNLRSLGRTMHHASEGKGSQTRILIILNEIGTIPQNELTQRLGIQPGSASEVIGKLESAGLISRTPSAADRRTLDISLTPAGQNQAREAVQRRDQQRQAMFSCLSDQQKDTLLSLLEQLEEDWENRYSRRKTR